MNYRTDVVEKELRELLRGHRFCPADGTMLVGKNLAVQSVPWQEGPFRVCNLEVRILPYAPAADSPEAVRKAQSDACLDLLRDPDMSVQSAARAALESLGKPPVPPDALKGLTIEFTQLTRRATTVRLREATDSHGRTIFKSVLMDTVCSLEVAPAESGSGMTAVGSRKRLLAGGGSGDHLEPEEDDPPGPPVRGDRIAHLSDLFVVLPPQPKSRLSALRGSAASNPDGGLVPASVVESFAAESLDPVKALGPQKPMAWIKSFVTKAQKRLAANVERDHNGRLWLTVLTTDPSLQGAIVEFQFITLTPKETPVQSGTLRLDEKVQDDCWQAICSLDLSEQNLERCEAKFEITPLAD